MQRLLRVAAAAVVAAAIAVLILPLLWAYLWPPSAGVSPEEPILFMHYYFYFNAASVAVLLLVPGIAVLVLFALARILDRLDEIRGRTGREEG